MLIELATINDINYLTSKDIHISEVMLKQKINNEEVYILRLEDKEIGWMRYSYFWDSIPFMNLIWLDEEYRGQALGKQVVQYWEEEMKKRAFTQVMTSTQADEQAQFFYRKLGYIDSGCLILDSQPIELLLLKKL